MTVAAAVETRPALAVRGATKRFGGVTALDGVSFTVRRGEVLGLIGPNGAGKTTLFNVVSRLYEPSEGSVRFADVDLLSLPSGPDRTTSCSRRR